jgi:hypothetical protein
VTVPISVMIAWAVRLSTPGIERSSSTAGAKGRSCSPLASERRSICSSRKSEVGEDRADQQRVQVVEAALERLAQRRDLLAQLAASEVGEQLRVGRAGPQGIEHRAAGDTEDVGGDAVELDAGVFERLVQPVGLALTLGDLRLTVAGKVAQCPDRRRVVPTRAAPTSRADGSPVSRRAQPGARAEGSGAEFSVIGEAAPGPEGLTRGRSSGVT